MVELTAGSASITVTASHNIVMSNGLPLQAADVSEGDQVLVTGNVAAVVSSVRHFRAVLDVFRVTFDPDEAVEAFLQPNLQILSMGQAAERHVTNAVAGGRGRTRRSGMNRRLQARRDADIADALSVPDTYNSFS